MHKSILPASTSLFALALAACGGSGAVSSTSSTGTTPTISVPGAPTGLIATAGSASANIAFTAPTSNGGAAISAYTATCATPGASITATATASPLTVAGLSNGSSYNCTIAASNSAGRGAESAAVTVLPAATGIATQSFHPPFVKEIPVFQNVVSLDQIIGPYKRSPVLDDWLIGDISFVKGSTSLLQWTNKAGASWTLTPDLPNNKLRTDKTNPYQSSLPPDFTLQFFNGKLIGFEFASELYQRDDLLFSIPTYNQNYWTGYTSFPIEFAPSEYGAGVSVYTAIWPLSDEHVNGFQVGAGTWLLPDNTTFTQALLPPDHKWRLAAPEAGPTWSGLFQTIEGGPGYWTATQFKTREPKFRINGTADGYYHELSSPGWGFQFQYKLNTPNALERDQTGIAQLSNRLLIPPDGITFKKGTSGEFLGYAWMALPLTMAKPNLTTPIGDQSWTLFFNSANFAGPVAFWVPDVFTRLAQNYPTANGRGLDVRSMITGGAAMEFGQMPGYTNKDAKGNTYTRIPRILFPTDGKGLTYLLADWTKYSKAALFQPMKQWLEGGNAYSGQFDSQFAYKLSIGNYPHSFTIGRIEGSKDFPVIGMDDFVKTEIVSTPGGGKAMGLRWGSKATAGVFPEYFQKTGDNYKPISIADVPTETFLTDVTFPNTATSRNYTSPISGPDSWNEPAPRSGPFTAKLVDGSVISYSWYRFIDQPSLQGFGWTIDEKNRLQAIVEKIHSGWASTRNFIPQPTVGYLVTLDQALIVTPPPGLEVGYVPIVTRQAMQN